MFYEEDGLEQVVRLLRVSSFIYFPSFLQLVQV